MDYSQQDTLLYLKSRDFSWYLRGPDSPFLKINSLLLYYIKPTQLPLSWGLSLAIAVVTEKEEEKKTISHSAYISHNSGRVVLGLEDTNFI